MTLDRTERFKREYAALPKSVQRRADKQITLFLENPRHPSLRVKKMEGFPNTWEGRISQDYRFTFQIRADTCTLRRIGPTIF